MRYGFVFPGGDAVTAARFGREAEQAGWDGFFLWEGLYGTDPWVTLATVAATTQRIRLGTLLTPLSRRRPWKVASEASTLDMLSDGRAILSVGLGAPETGFANFGEVTDRRTRAELMDEGLEIVTGLWQGQPFTYTGKHYNVRDLDTLEPSLLMPPRHIPIWVVGAWPRERSMRRVLRYDGLLPNVLNEDGSHEEVKPEHVRAMADYVHERRRERTPFDIIVDGRTPGDDASQAADIVGPMEEAGATWWIESLWDAPNLDMVWTRMRQGPPDSRRD
ncbi:MAG: LLM class flavin-dependent oxidoreductase [Caldilineaceae bacterium]